MSFTEPLGAPDSGDSFSASRGPIDLPAPPAYDDEVAEDDLLDDDVLVDDEVLGDIYDDDDDAVLDDEDDDILDDEVDEIGPEDEDFTETENLSTEPT